LDLAIQNKIELYVAYLYPYEQSPFKKGATTYYPIYSGNIILESFKNRFNSARIKDYSDKILELVEYIKPDIIHIHGSENTFHNIENKTDTPIVLSIQGNISVLNYKYLAGFYGRFINTFRNRLSIKSIILGRRTYNDDYKKLKAMAQLEQRNLPNIRHIIGRTDWDYRITRVLAPHSRYYVGNEVLRDAFYCNEWHMPQNRDKIIIHTTNGDNYYKGFETLCYALNLLNELGLDVEWRVAGVAQSSAINKVAKKFLRTNYPKKGLSLLGSINEEKLIESLLTCHMYVMPSHIENSPNNLCEAMILGMPCIATHAGGTASIMKNNEEGLIIQDGDPWAMAGAIIELFNNPDRALAMGCAARKTALRRHDKETIVNDLCDTYQQILKSEHK
jgi:glycosyltransferase involved in cell wall biosynthesis